MIASLRGTVTDIFQNFIIVEVNGVGYKVEGVGKFLEPQTQISLYIYTHYTQQDIRLFGFIEREAFLLFQDLLVVSGVGPKTAAALINNLGVEDIKIAILNDSPKSLTGNGVGLKTAQKIILELLPRIEKSGFIAKSKPKQADERVISEVEQALLGLGYNKKEISDVFEKIEINAQSDSETVLRNALNQIMKKQ